MKNMAPAKIANLFFHFKFLINKAAIATIRIQDKGLCRKANIFERKKNIKLYKALRLRAINWLNKWLFY
jgi:hypothetical protein